MLHKRTLLRREALLVPFFFNVHRVVPAFVHSLRSGIRSEPLSKGVRGQSLVLALPKLVLIWGAQRSRRLAILGVDNHVSPTLFEEVTSMLLIPSRAAPLVIPQVVLLRADQILRNLQRQQFISAVSPPHIRSLLAFQARV